MSDRRRFLKGLTSLPLATVLANPRLAAAVSAGLQEIEAKLSDGKTIKAALAVPQGQVQGSILLIHEWWGLNDQIKSVASEFANQGGGPVPWPCRGNTPRCTRADEGRGHNGGDGDAEGLGAVAA